MYVFMYFDTNLIVWSFFTSLIYNLFERSLPLIKTIQEDEIKVDVWETALGEHLCCLCHVCCNAEGIL